MSEKDQNACDEGRVQPTKVLAKFLASLHARHPAAVLDLGPVVGSTLTFFGEQLGCTIRVEDIFKDIDRHAREGRAEALPHFFDSRFPQRDETFDGILCWDAFDYLGPKAAPILARHLVRILKPDGALVAFFHATPPCDTDPRRFTRYVVVDPDTLEHRPYPAALGRRGVFQNRDIQRMFEPLRITDQVLLKSNVREVLFRKIAMPSSASA